MGYIIIKEALERHPLQRCEEARTMISIIAIEKGLRLQARFLLENSEDELQEMDFRERTR
jgi:hypothetical protein